MSRSDLAGRLLCVGVASTRLSSAERSALRRLQPGAVILFKRNYESRAQLTELCAEIHRAGVPPPLISVDQEGGRVIRFGPPFIRLESARVLAQQQTPAKVAELAETMGRELRAVGVEIDYAPVLDVLTNPASEVIADRAFASTAETVSLYGMAYMRGLIAAGIIPCVKHFPGHGNVREDSHRELPINQATRADLDESHLRPFIEAIAARVPMIMVAHLMTPVLDDVHPASLSSRHINDLLRRQLGFNGVIATDDLQMGALDRFGTLAERSVLALEAGADLLLVCREIEAVEDVFAVVGRLTESNGMTVQLGASAARIERLRRTSP